MSSLNSAVVDAHCHAHDLRLGAVQASLSAAWDQTGLDFAVVNGTREEDWDAVADLAARDSRVVPSLGVHPWFAGMLRDGWFERLERRVESLRGGVGEIGLDHWKEGLDLRLQEEVFLRQWEVAARRHLPTTVHCLKAHGRLRELLRGLPVSPCGWLLHSYSGPAELVPQFAGMGAYFSCSGAFLHENRSARIRVLALVPPDRLLVETDAPDMAGPASCRPFDAGPGLNHPANIRAVVDGLAHALGEPPQELAARTSANARRLFGALLSARGAS